MYFKTLKSLFVNRDFAKNRNFMMLCSSLMGKVSPNIFYGNKPAVFIAKNTLQHSFMLNLFECEKFECLNIFGGG